MTLAPMWAKFGIGVLSGVVTLVGGSLVLRLRSALDLLLGFSTGSIIGIALFDLLPEAINVAGQRHNATSIASAVAVGFAAYLAVDRGSAIVARGSIRQSHFAPATLTLHSFLDGLGIGLAFHISPTAGAIVAIGVLAHDLIDGANTVVMSLSSGASGSTARSWLLADAAAPLAGILLASTISIPASSLAIMLAVFAGFFLYIGATGLLRLGSTFRPRVSAIAATGLGLTFIYAVNWITSVRR